MTIQLPALACRASLIATVTVVLAAALAIPAGAAAAGGSASPVLEQGTGMAAKPSVPVRRVQQALQRRGYGVGAPGADGRFGPLTAAAVRKLQAARGLAADGVVGKRTLAALHLRGRTASAAQGRSRHQPQAVTSTTTTTSPPAAPDAAPPVPGTNSRLGQDRSPSVVGAVLFWGLLAAFVCLAVAGLARLVSRTRSSRSQDDERVPAAVDAAGTAATDAVNGFLASPAPQGDGMIGYITTSTDAWSDADEGSAAAIEATCRDSAWDLVEIVCDRENGRTLDRPGLNYALDRIAEGSASGLVVSDLKRLSRSHADIDALIGWFHDADATLVDLVHDPSTRGRDGGEGAPPNGRSALKDHPDLVDRIRGMRSANMSLKQIADQFNAERIPTLRGGREWRPSTIQGALGFTRPERRDRVPPVHGRGGDGG